jgi:hypothetical protein
MIYNPYRVFTDAELIRHAGDDGLVGELATRLSDALDEISELQKELGESERWQ